MDGMVLDGQWQDSALHTPATSLEGARELLVTCGDQRSCGGRKVVSEACPRGLCLQLSHVLLLESLKGNELRFTEYLLCPKPGVRHFTFISLIESLRTASILFGC